MAKNRQIFGFLSWIFQPKITDFRPDIAPFFWGEFWADLNDVDAFLWLKYCRRSCKDLAEVAEDPPEVVRNISPDIVQEFCARFWPGVLPW